MQKSEVYDLVQIINQNYPTFIKEGKEEDLINVWFKELQQYDYEDVLEALKSYMAQEKYQYQPPTLYLLISGLTKKHEKKDWSKGTFYCSYCKRAFNSEEEQKQHEDRHRSIKYVIRETKKWFKKELTEKFLWTMSEEEFNERYNKLLKYIMEHTTDEAERKRISFIFNPPTKEQALEFLKGEQK